MKQKTFMLFFRKSYLLYFVLGSTLLSCKKTETAPKTEQSENTNSLDKIKVNSSFNWSTYNSVNFAVKGIPALSSEKNVLSVTSIDGESLFFTGFYSMADDINESLQLPKVVDEVKVSFGSISKTIKIDGGKINFSYVSDAPQDEN